MFRIEVLGLVRVRPYEAENAGPGAAILIWKWVGKRYHDRIMCASFPPSKFSMCQTAAPKRLQLAVQAIQPSPWHPDVQRQSDAQPK